ncbi:hypothetical protein [Sulfurimonas sp.]|uniref:hypothetical protein n=1 Tax=Sulfurimonas sp. TaxID=2022749 RepID=UPI002A36360C|nr:hypothetical protein [Sulfurimonas sp.]
MIVSILAIVPFVRLIKSAASAEILLIFNTSLPAPPSNASRDVHVSLFTPVVAVPSTTAV